MTTSIGVGLIGTGFMGECHALAFRAAPAVFRTRLGARLEMVADIDAGAAQRAADRFGFARATGDWRELVSDPKVDLVAITSPNLLHKPMALAALEAGKHVYCEKPLALTAADAAEMAAAAAKAGTVTMVGYNYLRSPAVSFAARLIRDGAIGRVTYFRGVSDEDYMADPAVPMSWRCRRDQAGSGALGDIGSHILSVALSLIGPIAEVSADQRTVIAERPLPAAGEGRERRDGAAAVTAETAKVENEDQTHALLRFAGGTIGTVATSRVAWGRKNHLAFEVFGAEGAILFDQERMNELQLYQPGAAPGDRNGFRTVLTGPAHPHYGAFSPAAGHGLGFNDLKVIEVAQLLDAIAGGPAAYPDFAVAAALEKVSEAIGRSAAERRWIRVGS
ncbi:Gfo/Idh/MocA family oxidoreductase [Inquilinus limosus]|uniref:Gfo/Idh/MocA family protein n=1 Tax=Inquilinus limosus TaxID=171674 RepID=UPI003F151025